MEIQELISRGRFIFHGAPNRLEVFKSVNGKRSAKDIVAKTKRKIVNILHDLQKMRDMELIKPKIDNKGEVVRKQDYKVYEKAPLLRHVSIKYFQDPIKAKKKFGKRINKKVVGRQLKSIPVPLETGILEICRNGEDQLYEFKAAGVDIDNITREIGAFLNTKLGGIVFYGIDDDGTISGSDKHRQKLDQSLHNSIRANIEPQATVTIKEKDVAGYGVIIIIIPPWNRKDVYHYKGKVLIRRGTNVFTAKAEESKRLHRGEYVI